MWRNYAPLSFVPLMAQHQRCTVSSFWKVFAHDDQRTVYPPGHPTPIRHPGHRRTTNRQRTNPASRY
jgi:hypothetical protein